MEKSSRGTSTLQHVRNSLDTVQRPIAKWTTFASILLGLVAGAAFAIGHHSFYQSLDGSPAPSTEYNAWVFDITAQQVNIAAGTALAFLVSASLGHTLTIAYTQLLWSRVKHTYQGPTLAELDTVFSALSDFSTIPKSVDLVEASTVVWAGSNELVCTVCHQFAIQQN